jgi:hypothetical protein
MQIPVLLILLAVGGTQQGTSDEAPREEDIARLIQQLGDRKFTVRQSATRSLKAIGRPAIPALRKAESTSKSEVKLRVASILEHVLGTASRKAFLKDPTIANARNVVFWKRLRGFVDSDEAAIELMRSWLTSEPRLFQTQVLGGNEFADELRNSASRLTNFVEQSPTAAELQASITALAFVSSDASTQLTKDARKSAESIFEMGATRRALSPTSGNLLLRKLAGDWVSQTGSQYQKLILSLKYSLPEGLPLAEAIILSEARGPRMQYALHIVGKLGSEKQIPLLLSQLNNKTPLSKPKVVAVRPKQAPPAESLRRPQVKYEYRVCDVALAMLWHLHGENPAAHGFDPKRVRSHAWFQFPLDALGFDSEEQRVAAFAEWQKFDRKAVSGK